MLPPILYHAIATAPSGDALHTSAKWGGTLPAETAAALGTTAEHPPLVFATPDKQLAAAYLFDGHKGEVVVTSTYAADQSKRLTVITDRDATMNRPRDARMFAFSAAGFAPLGRSRQYVSASDVPFSRTRIAVEVRRGEEILRTGLQVFSLAQSRTVLVETGKWRALCDGSNLVEALAEGVRSGDIVWENDARGVAPDAEMRALLQLPG